MKTYELKLTTLNSATVETVAISLEQAAAQIREKSSVKAAHDMQFHGKQCHAASALRCHHGF